MTVYSIIETENGWSIITRQETEDPAAAAERHRGVLIDPGPYQDYDDAREALIALEGELEDDSSDVPADRPLEDRYELND
jgi:hypothetical protein